MRPCERQQYAEKRELNLRFCRAAVGQFQTLATGGFLASRFDTTADSTTSGFVSCAACSECRSRGLCGGSQSYQSDGRSRRSRTTSAWIA